MAALLRHGLRRIGGSVLQRTQAALTSPAVAEERRRLLPRRMLYTGKQHPCVKTTSSETGPRITNKLTLFQRGCWKRDGDLAEQFRRLKPFQTCWQLIKSFPETKVFKIVAGTIVLVVMFVDATTKICIIAALITANVMLVSVSRAQKREKAENKRQAEKMREQ